MTKTIAMITNMMMKLKAIKQKLKNCFNLSPEQTEYAQNELRFLFGIKEKKPGEQK